MFGLVLILCGHCSSVFGLVLILCGHCSSVFGLVLILCGHWQPLGVVGGHRRSLQDCGLVLEASMMLNSLDPQLHLRQVAER